MGWAEREADRQVEEQIENEENRRLVLRYYDALMQIRLIPHKLDGGDWDEIEEAQRIAREALNK